MEIHYSNKFKKSYKLAQRRGLDITKLNTVIEILASNSPLPPVYKDHQLTGNYANCRECHIEPDWLLIYQIIDNKCVLFLVDTGTHSDLFK